MPTWNELLTEWTQQPEDSRIQWLLAKMGESAHEVAQLRGDKNVILYGSAFLQKQNVPASHVSLTHEEINGLMGVIKGMNWNKGLTLILHTPGGITNATESFVDYLRAKFSGIEVIVPTFAMSAGTMISLASDRIVMGKHSQLGPIDPQMPMPGGRSYSARAIVEQFNQAKREIVADQLVAHAWAPIIATSGPALLQEAQNNLDYSEQMVANWLAKFMFAGDSDNIAHGKAVAEYFNDNTKHKSHGRRIGIDEVRAQGVVVEELEANQDLQESVLTIYHLMTVLFEQTLITKIIWSNNSQSWIKNWNGAA